MWHETNSKKVIRPMQIRMHIPSLYYDLEIFLSIKSYKTSKCQKAMKSDHSTRLESYNDPRTNQALA